MAGITDKHADLFEALGEDPLLFAETLLTNPNDGSPFEALYVQKEFLAAEEKTVWCCFHRRAGKALPLSSKVYTPEGYKLIKDINIGDVVLTPTGTANVTQIYNFESKPLIRFTFDDGTHIESCEDHLWSIYSNSENLVLSSKEILANLVKNSDRSNYKIPVILPAQHIKKDLPLDPYILGSLVGSSDLEFTDLVLRAAEVLELIDSDGKTSVATKILNYPSAAEDILEKYLYSDIEDRKALLKGILDNSARLNANHQFLIRTVHKKQSEDISNLARSLGCKVFIEKEDTYKLRILCPAFLELSKGTKTKYLDKEIVKAEYCGLAPVKCIGIDSEDHLFITDNYTATHNCLEGSSLVLNPETLRPTPLSSLYDVKETITFDFKANEVVWSGAKWHKNPERKTCIKIELESGVDLTLSCDHEVFSKDKGWVKAGTLTIKDKILAPSIIPVYGNIKISDQLAAELALGSMGDVSYTSNEIVDDRSVARSIPDIVFQLDKYSLGLYLKYIFEYYGRFFKTDEYIRIACSEVVIAKDLHHLLLRLGVCGIINKDSDLIITDPIDINTFFNSCGYNVEILDVRAPRRWEAVVNTKQYGYRDVYDLEVDHDDHNFIANDIVVHNSYGLAVKAIFRAVTKANQTILIFSPSDVQRREIFSNIDGFIRTSEILKGFIDKKAPNSNDNPTVRTFKNGTKIEGHIVGVGNQTTTREGRRGLTADWVFVDEAQEIDPEAWRVITPIMKGNIKRKCQQACIFGTIILPEGHFYDMVFKKAHKERANSRVLRIPITQNKDYTREMVQELIDEGDIPETIWKTEYLLEPSSMDTSVFRLEQVDKAFLSDYEYGPADKPLIKSGRFRVMGVDWDKVQAGSTIVIGEYNPVSQEVQIIWREEIPRSKFSLSMAVNRVFELSRSFAIHCLVVDEGYGALQIEEIQLRSMERGLDLHEKLVSLSMQKRLEVPDVQNPEETVKKYAKDFIIELTRRKFEEGKLKFPSSDDKARKQFYKYEVLKESETRKSYSKEDEHIIDATAFIMYGIFLNFGISGRGDWSDNIADSLLVIDTAASEEEKQRASDQVWKQYDNFGLYDPFEDFEGESDYFPIDEI